MSNGRVRRGPDEWRATIDRFIGTGLGLREFCRKEKLNLTSFQRWQKRLAASETPVEFIDVTPTKDDTSPWAMEIELAGGTILRLRG